MAASNTDLFEDILFSLSLTARGIFSSTFFRVIALAIDVQGGIVGLHVGFVLAIAEVKVDIKKVD